MRSVTKTAKTMIEISASSRRRLQCRILQFGWTILILSFCCSAIAVEWPGERWTTASPSDVGLDEGKLIEARDYALTGGGSGYITRHGKLVLQWGDPAQRYDLKSTTKSFGAAALGIAVKDGKMKLEDKARKFHPSLGLPPETNAARGWINDITILHLASQTAGFEKPGGYTRQLFRPGTKWDYSDSGPNWLAECITLIYGRDLDELMFERVFTPIGIERSDLVWRKNQYRPHLIEGVMRREFGAGIHANVDAMARFGYLFLREGLWKEEQILPRDFVRRAVAPIPQNTNLAVLNTKDYGNASRHYGLLWWNNADGTLKNVPTDAYWSWGLYDSLILVIPSLEIVVARAGKSWKREKEADHYDVLEGFFEPIAAAATGHARKDRGSAPVPGRSNVQASTAAAPGDGRTPKTIPPRSPVIAEIKWAARDTIIRRAEGSDNWPMTWGDDDALYTAYGDGWGFGQRRGRKLSLGLARITGTSPNFSAMNVPAPSLEQIGDGARGMKASGILMVDGVLYLWARNATNSQLVWSSDHGKTWTWADWRWRGSFGCPTFLNFGRNYSGARDEFVYTYSLDRDDAYTPADRMILARVPKNRIREQAGYEFLVHLDESGRPVWTNDLSKRGSVFSAPGQCYRSGVTYNPGLKRYLWCQTLPIADTKPARYGLAIYDAPEPWGPWSTAFYADHWDVDAGETASFPTKWMSSDGKELHLVFASEDSFSVRKATVTFRD